MPKKPEPIVPILPHNSLRNLDWYIQLVDEAKAIAVQTRFESNVRLLEGKWLLGRRIYEDEMNAKRAGYGDNLVEMLSRDLGTSTQGLWKCIQFYKKYPKANFENVVSDLSGVKRLTWFEICKSVLPSSKKNKDIKFEMSCQHEVFKCVKCKKEFDLATIKEMLNEQM
jgi:hypothetical protein